MYEDYMILKLSFALYILILCFLLAWGLITMILVTYINSSFGKPRLMVIYVTAVERLSSLYIYDLGSLLFSCYALLSLTMASYQDSASFWKSWQLACVAWADPGFLIWSCGVYCKGGHELLVLNLPMPCAWDEDIKSHRGWVYLCFCHWHYWCLVI